MNIQHVLKTLKDHADEEVQIHKEVFNEPDKSIKYLLEKHLRDIMKIHKAFWNKLKKAAKSD
jgi:hypothetical protein